MMGMGGFGMMLSMVLFWLLIVGLAVWLISSLFPRTPDSPARGPGSEAGSSLTAVEILKQRYARGEISKAEFDEIRRELDPRV